MPQRGPAHLLVVLTAWLVAVALVGVGGEFPLSDDWAYAHVVRSLGEGRGFDLLPWTGASLVVQVLYGWAACLVTGFSYVTLRVTTLVLSAAGIAAFFALLGRLGAGARVAAFGAVLLAFSPLWFHLSFTFMTDVPFAALALVAAWLDVKALQTGSRRGLLAAAAVTAAALLIRQHAVWIALAAALTALLPTQTDAGTRHPRERLFDAVVALSLPLAAAAAWTLWALTSSTTPLAVHNKVGDMAAVSMLSTADVAFRALATLGFLVLPWSLTLRLERGRERRTFAAFLAVLAAVALFAWVRDSATMFYLGNVLGDFTIGARTTRDLFYLAIDYPPVAGPVFHLVLTAASLASAAAVATRIATALPSALRRTATEPRARAAVFCVLALALSGLGSLAQAQYYFDRYLVAIVPLAVASLVALSPPARTGPVFAGALAAMSLYAVAGTHDYMESHRARWNLLAGLEARGITADAIDGGVEYNAERRAAALRTAPNPEQARVGQSAANKSWWWVTDDAWIIAFGPLDGYAEAGSRSFPRWLPPGEGKVFVLERIGRVEADVPE